MKTTKLILVFALLFTLFNSCSNEEYFSEEIEESKTIVQEVVSNPDTKNTSSSSSNRSVFPSNLSFAPDFHTVYGSKSYATITYNSNVSDKNSVRNGIIDNNPNTSYLDMGNDKDLIIYDFADIEGVHLRITSYHQIFKLIDSFNPTVVDVCYSNDTTNSEINLTEAYFTSNHGLEIVIDNGLGCDIWVFNVCCAHTQVCPDIETYSINHNLDITEGVVQ